MRCLLVAAFVALTLEGVALPAPAHGESPRTADTLAISLEESVKLALAGNAGIRVSREKVNEATAAVRESETAFLPQVSGSAGYTRLDVAPFIPASRFASFGGSSPFGGAMPDKITLGIVDNYSTSLKLEQPLFTGGKIKNRYDISKLARHTAESELDLAASELVFETRKAYLECIQAQKQERVAEETVRQFEAHLRDLQAMFDVGLAATNDLLKTKVYHSDSKLALLKAQHAVKLARKNLLNVINVPLTTEIVLTSSVDSVTGTTVDLESAIRTGIERRAELRSMEYRKRMIQKEIEIGRSACLPDIYFFANLGYKYPDREYARDFYSTWSMGILAQMNVFDWGRTAYGTQQSRSRLMQLEMTGESMKDAVALDVTRTYLALLDAWNGIAVARESMAQAEENYRVTNERFKEGLVTNTDLLDAEVLLTAAKTSYGNLLVQYLIARADFERATGSTEN